MQTRDRTRRSGAYRLSACHLHTCTMACNEYKVVPSRQHNWTAHRHHTDIVQTSYRQETHCMQANLAADVDMQNVVVAMLQVG